MELITLKNGLRLALEPVPAVRSASAGIWVANGSRCEASDENGISHFIEHMLFKGTTLRTAGQIASEMDRYGGQVNAFTSKEYTAFYLRTLDRHLTDALEVLCDMFFNSTFLDRDIEIEKTVIYEEIDMYEDSPEDLVCENLAQSVYTGSPLGFPIIGSRETLSPMTGTQLHNYMKRHYVPENIVVAIAGSYSDAAIARITELFESIPVSPAPQVVPAVYTRAESAVAKPIEQNHICLGFPGLCHHDADRYALQVFQSILGGGMSSRLFQRVREDAGLCYSIYSYTSAHADTGMLSIYCGLSRDAQEHAMTLIREEITRLLHDGPTPEELDRTRGQIEANLLMGLESTMTRMNQIGRSALLYGKLIDVDTVIERYDAVTREDVLAIGRRVCDFDRMSTAIVGKI